MNNREWLYSMDVADLSDWFDAEHVEEQAHESRENYEERMYDVPVSDCPYCGCSRVVIHDYCDAYDRPHSYRVEHEDEREAFNCECFESYYAFDSVEKAVEHADMRYEPTNGIDGETNGIADGITLPDGDAVAVLREYGRQCDSSWERKRIDEIADMVERDYVSRAMYDNAHETMSRMQAVIDDYEDSTTELEETITTLEAERDELTNAINELQKKQPYCYDPEVPLDTLRTVGRYIDELQAERDEWKAKVKTLAGYSNYWRGRCAKLEHRSDKRAAAVERLDGVEQATDENLLDAILGAPAGLNLHGAEKLITLKALLTDGEGSSNVRVGSSKSAKRAAAVERLKHTWRACIKDTRQLFGDLVGKDAPVYAERCDFDALIDLLTDDDGAARSNDGVTNLEWLYEHDREKLLDLASKNVGCRTIFDCPDLVNGECTNQNSNLYSACYKRLREWLMAPHEDAHSKAQSTTEPNMSEQSESLSDEADSREKLEEDVRQILYSAYMLAWMHGHENRRGSSFEKLHREFYNLLDRQAAITERETTLRELYKFEKNHREHIDSIEEVNRELNRRIAELTEQLEAAHAKNRALKLHISKMQQGRHGWHVKGVELQRQVDELTAQLHASNAERARLRECLGIATDNAHDFLTLVDESGNVYERDEGLA